MFKIKSYNLSPEEIARRQQPSGEVCRMCKGSVSVGMYEGIGNLCFLCASELEEQAYVEMIDYEKSLYRVQQQ